MPGGPCGRSSPSTDGSFYATAPNPVIGCRDSGQSGAGLPFATAETVAWPLLRPQTMDQAISLDLNGKLTLRLQLIGGAVLAALIGWADTGRARAFDAQDPVGHRSAVLAGWYPADLHVGGYEAA